MSWGRDSGNSSPGPALLLGKSGGPLQSQNGLGEEMVQAIETCNTNCQLIASQAEHLQRMRSRCVPSAPLTQQEIRNVEEKLVKLFSLLLVTKRKIPIGTLYTPQLLLYPSLQQWLEVVGLSKDVVKGICREVTNLEILLERDETELHALLSKHGSDIFESNKLARAMASLRKCTEAHEQQQVDSLSGSLHWDSWDTSTSVSSISSLSHSSYRRARVSVSSSDGDGGSGIGDSGFSRRTSDESNPSSPPLNLPSFPPPSPGASIHSLLGMGGAQDKRFTPPSTPSILSIGSKTSGDRRQHPPTPPPCKKNMLQNVIISQVQSQQLQSQLQPSLGRSTSHESQLSHRLEQEKSHLPTLEQQVTSTPRRARLRSDSGAESVMASEHTRNPHGTNFFEEKRSVLGSCGDFGSESPINMGGLRVQGSPLTSRGFSGMKMNRIRDEEGYSKHRGKANRNAPIYSGSMGHNVRHRFGFALKPDKCGYCQQKYSLLGGLKCKECSFKCHRECVRKIPPSCGLPRELLQVFTEKLRRELEQHSKGGSRGILEGLPKGGISCSQPAINSIPTFSTLDSSSNTSSCNSSTPSSPALIIPPSPAHKQPAFVYSEALQSFVPNPSDLGVDLHPWGSGDIGLNSPPPPLTPASAHNASVLGSRQSHDSDRTVSTSGSGSTGTDDSERTVAGRENSQDSTISEGDCGSEQLRCTRQNSVSSVSQALKEWDIPYEEIQHGDVLGRGRFGTVYSGHWHGQIAIKELNMEYMTDEKSMEAFKSEVSIFHKTRHENLILFMGACMKPPRLAIVTSLCKGSTLYRHIHTLKDRFTMSKTIPIGQQIAQGMGYLHARGIIHKDFKSKNIFLRMGELLLRILVFLMLPDCVIIAGETS